MRGEEIDIVLAFDGSETLVWDLLNQFVVTRCAATAREIFLGRILENHKNAD